MGIEFPKVHGSSWLIVTRLFRSDCPEREATYIITNGGISDPEKV